MTVPYRPILEKVCERLRTLDLAPAQVLAVTPVQADTGIAVFRRDGQAIVLDVTRVFECPTDRDIDGLILDHWLRQSVPATEARQ